MADQNNTKELLHAAVNGTVVDLQALMAGINEEMAGNTGQAKSEKDWHGHLLRLRAAIAAIGVARFGFGWNK